MADTPILALPRKPLHLAKDDEKTRKPIFIAQRIMKLLGISKWSELTKGDEPYFGF